MISGSSKNVADIITPLIKLLAAIYAASLSSAWRAAAKQGFSLTVIYQLTKISLRRGEIILAKNARAVL